MNTDAFILGFEYQKTTPKETISNSRVFTDADRPSTSFAQVVLRKIAAAECQNETKKIFDTST
ncbi:MAG: hypothetical protein AAGA56_19275, partial [Myxococcota bacterium]